MDKVKKILDFKYYIKCMLLKPLYLDKSSYYKSIYIQIYQVLPPDAILPRFKIGKLGFLYIICLFSFQPNMISISINAS